MTSWATRRLRSRSVADSGPAEWALAALSARVVGVQIPRTIENSREVDETEVKADDVEVVQDEQQDEFAEYFAGTKVRLGEPPA